MAKIVITIDGPAGSGKSTVSRMLAKQLEFAFLDTGAMYRAVTLAAMQTGTDMKDQDKILKLFETRDFNFELSNNKTIVYLDGKDITDQIRSAIVTANSKHIASAPKVREKLIEMQRNIVDQGQRIVTEGRDQGTVAFPDADVKFFITANIDERAKRRFNQLKGQGNSTPIEEIKEAIIQRDKSDRERLVGALIPAEDAIMIDTTDIDAEQVVNKLIQTVREKCEL